MYIGPWQEYKLASQMRRQDWKEHKKLKQFYSDWQRQCKKIGEVQATNELVWGPLFASLHGTTNNSTNISKRNDYHSGNNSAFQTSHSAKHGCRRKLIKGSELRVTQSMNSNRNYYKNGINSKNEYIYSDSNNCEAKQWDSQQYNKIKRKTSMADEGDKIIYANPKRYKPASQSSSLPFLFPKNRHKYNNNTLSSSLSSPKFSNTRDNIKNNVRQYIEKENNSGYSPQNVPIERRRQQQQYDLKRSPIRAKKKKKGREKKTEKERRLEKKNPYIQGTLLPENNEQSTTASSHFLPPVDINIKYNDNANLNTNRYFTNNNNKLLMKNNNKEIGYNFNNKLTNASRQPLSPSQQRISSPSSDIFEEEVDALLDWTDLLVPEMVS